MPKRIFWAVFAAAFLLRLAIASQTWMFHEFVPTETEGIARNVMGFGHYDLYYSPTAFATPVFPLFMAGFFAIFGMGLASQAIKVTLTCAVNALRCGLTPLFALDAGFDRAVAIASGVLSVVYIGAFDTELSGGLDGPYVALALLVMIWGGMRIWRSGSWQTRTPWWYYAFWGFAALLNPSVLSVMVGMLAVGAVACPTKARTRYFGQAALAVAGILVFLTPWAIRNYKMLGSPIFTRSNFGMEFWVSNGPGRTFDHPNNYEAFHPTRNPAEAAQVRALGEVEYSRVRFAEGLDWVRNNPGDYLKFAVKRTAAWWFPPVPLYALPAKLLLTLLAFAGLWLMFRRAPLVAWLLLITWLTFPDLYYLVQWSSRYRYPMDWQLVFAASVVLAAGWQKLVRARREAPREAEAEA